ncbi:hypothetical protein ACFPL7_13870 [Dongia soli]|uniref:Uncharacterized protein n=1 Tax=Dongia soli TaxID=600628 RepID=A0ABU5EDM8_9PROT|nr:hypothetical protein [Dongia soli]MDY0884017.1 hypothetical protein [Dongia soli]
MGDPTDDPASPVCYLPEVEDGYAGYLTKPEVAALLRRWRRLATSTEIAEQLAALSALETAADEGASDDINRDDAGQLRREILSVLPRIRDDELHRRLRDLASRL